MKITANDIGNVKGTNNLMGFSQTKEISAFLL